MTGDSLVFPTKEQAIVCNAIADLTLTDYVKAIGRIVSPKNVIYAFKLSKERICIYLSATFWVDEVVSNHSSISIKDKGICVRRLINPARRIILSNVCPSIPNRVLENQIKAFGFTTLSQMTVMKAAILDDEDKEYSHVLNSRRQIYVQPSDTVELPSSLVLKFENTNYRIFFIYDDICFKCKLTGHHANECPNLTVEATPNPLSAPTLVALTTTDLHSFNAPASSNKRPPTDDVDEETSEPNSLDLSLDGKSKKLKASDSTESLTPMSDLLLPARELITEKHDIFPLDFNQTVEFMGKAHGEKDILPLIYKYTDDAEGIVNQLYEIYTVLDHKSIKNRCIKVQRKIRKAINATKTGTVNLNRLLNEPVDLTF